MANSITLSQITSTINKLVATEAPKTKIVEQTDKGTMVGEFSIVPNNTGFDVLKKGKWHTHFENKVIAFEYAMNYPRTKYKKTYLESIDKTLTRYKIDAAYHLGNIKYCRKHSNNEGVVHYENLLSECRFKINQCINSAAKFSKYNF